MAKKVSKIKRKISKNVSKGRQQTKLVRSKLGKINDVLGKLEVEVQKTLSLLKKNSEKSSKIIKENFDDLIEKIGVADIYSIASEKTEEIRFEIRRLADDVVERVKDFDFSSVAPVFSEIRSSIDQVIDKIQDAGWVEIAKDKALNTRKQFLNVFSLPSKDEVKELNRKVVHLEKKLQTLSKRRKAA